MKTLQNQHVDSKSIKIGCKKVQKKSKKVQTIFSKNKIGI